MNTTRMHVFTHVRPESCSGKSGMPGNEYADGMMEHDGDVGKLLKALDDLGIADNTIVVYTTDNGPNQFSWPDAATTPFRSEKDTNWEGAFRVPAMIRWPGTIKPGAVSNEMFSGLDWFPTLLAAAGDTDIKDRLLKGYQARRQDLQGPSRRLQPAALPDRPAAEERAQRVLLLQRRRRARRHALRRLEDRLLRAAHAGRLRGLANPFTCLRAPKIFNLRMDPFERADIVSDQYYDWLAKNAYLLAIRYLAGAPFLQTFKEYSAQPAACELQHRSDGQIADEDAGQGSDEIVRRECPRLSGSRRDDATSRPPPLAAG